MTRMRDEQLWNLLERTYLLVALRPQYCSNLTSHGHGVNRPRVLLSTTHLSTSSVRRKDPWSSMPHTPEHIASTTSPANTPPPNPLPRPGASIETTRARVSYTAH
ncbi:hypothetical protein V8E52_011123 [Russula decolorans]